VSIRIPSFVHRLPWHVKYLDNIIFISFHIVLTIASVRPRLVYLHDFVCLPVSVLMKLLYHYCLVYDSHELQAFKVGFGGFHSRFVKAIESLCWPYINGMVTVSNSIARWYISSYGYMPHTVILNTSQFRNTLDRSLCTNYIHRMLGLPANAKLYVYVGALERGAELNIP